MRIPKYLCCRLGKRRTLILPSFICDALNITEGELFLMQLEGGNLVIAKTQPEDSFIRQKPGRPSNKKRLQNGLALHAIDGYKINAM